MISKQSDAGIGHSVAELHGVRHFFAVAAPRQDGPFRRQAEDVLRILDGSIRAADGPSSIVMQTVFLRDINDQSLCRQMMRDFYGREMPATTYVADPPCEGKLLSVEALGMDAAPNTAMQKRGCPSLQSPPLEIARISDDLVVARHNGVTWAYLAHLPPISTDKSAYNRSLATFDSAGDRLAAAGFRFEDVIRTWLYLGDINMNYPDHYESRIGPSPSTFRYDELNRARASFFRDLNFGAGLVPRGLSKPVYPASTGIGACGRDVTLSCIAMKTDRTDVVLLPLENPQQTAAYEYAHNFQRGNPKFSRAMAVIQGELVTIYISGTASITASESRHLDTIERQTHQTLDNIEALISADNFRAHGFPGVGATLADLALSRIYIKRPEDTAVVRAICRERLGELPATFLIADICRNELLMEIEGIALRHRSK
jgi:enamine deaminase RidA (YjgF/YER057c/UK114 family)